MEMKPQPMQFLESQVCSPETKHHWAFSLALKTKYSAVCPTYLVLNEKKKKIFFFCAESHVVDSVDLFQEFGLASYGSEMESQMFPLTPGW